MDLKNIPIPEVYRSSSDFRTLINWFSLCLDKVRYDTDNIIDLLDPERCPSSLLWMLADTMGFKYDSRFAPAYNRLILIYFLAMIYNRGSRNGVMLASELNIAQFTISNEDKQADRLENSDIPVNSVYVTSDVEHGYIDIVYYSENMPTDACLEYVRPIGMYCIQHAGVKFDAKTQMLVDARLTNIGDTLMNSGPTHISNYSRKDYASLQQVVNSVGQPAVKQRDPVYKTNSAYEKDTSTIYPGLRSLYSLQLCNNTHIVKSLLPSIFELGYDTSSMNVNLTYPDSYVKGQDKPQYNLIYDKGTDAATQGGESSMALNTLDPNRTSTPTSPAPKVNAIFTLDSSINISNLL